MGTLGSVEEFSRTLVVFFAYVVAAQALQPAISSLSLRAGIALLATLLLVALADAIPSLLRGETPRFDEGSYVHAARGFFALAAFVLLAAVVADWLRGSFAVQEWLVTVISALVAGVGVFGGLVAYYRRRTVRSRSTEEIGS
ncbi:hypothetical protein [Halegenticoccus tardaugens]|uniref:hypothetical protein n=1 Tax=Halegenticoccus tardaugens TaxID=2071624 RepID=UPI00100A9FE0|nr:hypothetical protein [Halegenticoccus tardaugens]